MQVGAEEVLVVSAVLSISGTCAAVMTRNEHLRLLYQHSNNTGPTWSLKSEMMISIHVVSVGLLVALITWPG